MPLEWRGGKTAEERQRRCPKKPPIPPPYCSDAPSAEPIYSVVRKSRGGLEISASGRREELENWLRTTGAAASMGDWQRKDDEDATVDHERFVPRGVVGLVGPYR